ncbi:MAG: DNA-cytosine methyltransferase family protein [Pseudomonadota bacterium]
MTHKPIPVVDLFAGPGGLGEGFSSVLDDNDQPFFQIKLSIEKDPVAHQTLTLRSLYRALKVNGVPDSYYQYIRGHITKAEFFALPQIATAYEEVKGEARCMELGNDPKREIDDLIRKAIEGHDEWLLIGGPPCQAYSMAGRSRRRKKDPEKFEEDPKHFLYQEYLRVIKEFKPTIFVMENVKGMLSSKHGGKKIFDRIMADLREPETNTVYDIRSFVVKDRQGGLRPEDFTIQSEKYNVPQTRHRVILLGICHGRAGQTHTPLKPDNPHINLADVFADMPPLRSKLSRRTLGRGKPDSSDEWARIVADSVNYLDGLADPVRAELEFAMREASNRKEFPHGAGAAFLPKPNPMAEKLQSDLASWLRDDRLQGVIQHEARGHMETDLHRYLFAACYGKTYGISPRLSHFPVKLLPDHKNATQKDVPFDDRFRVQLYNGPSTTVVSHIAKDGHYYIHPDPAQCRSLTVREAARLQTFPDNYFFEGNRTEQYHQVGNAVPPFLARQLAFSVKDIFSREKIPGKIPIQPQKVQTDLFPVEIDVEPCDERLAA